MSKLQMLRASVKQRLNMEIFGLFERKMADYEEEISRLKENDQQHKLLNAVFNPTVQLHRSDVQQLLMIKEEVPPELWTSQEGEQLNRLEEADTTRLPFTAIPVMSQDDEEKPQCSQLHRSQTEDKRKAEPPASSSVTQITTETDGEDCGGSQPARNVDIDHHPQPNTKASDSSETELSYDDWQEPVSDSGPETEDGVWKVDSQMRIHTVKKPFGCDVCGKIFSRKTCVMIHMRVHTGEKPFGCDICGKSFSWKTCLMIHMRVHTGEKPFGCDICGKSFSWKTCLKRHMTVHTE